MSIINNPKTDPNKILPMKYQWARRHYKNGNSLDIGFRALDIDYENGSGLTEVGLDLSLTGLTIGYTFDL